MCVWHVTGSFGRLSKWHLSCEICWLVVSWMYSWMNLLIFLAFSNVLLQICYPDGSFWTNILPAFKMCTKQEKQIRIQSKNAKQKPSKIKGVSQWQTCQASHKSWWKHLGHIFQTFSVLLWLQWLKCCD